MSIRSLGASDHVGEVIGWLAEQVDRGAIGVVAVVVREDGTMAGHAFGEMSLADVCMAGAYLQSRMVDALEGEP